MDPLKALYEQYLDHVMSSINSMPVVNILTGERKSADENFMEEVERLTGVMSFARLDFRQQMAIQVARLICNKQAWDVDCFPMLKRGLLRYLERRNNSWGAVFGGSVPGECPSTSSPGPPPPPPPPIPMSLDELKTMLAEGYGGPAFKVKFTNEGGWWESN